MAQGRDSAVVATMLLCLLLLRSEMAHAATTYTVGGPGGWTFNVANWPKGKSFKAGDTLVFNYSPAAHNVVKVNQAGYQGCTSSRGTKPFQTGKDQFKLAKGPNYFICSFTGHCQSGMKIAAFAT